VQQHGLRGNPVLAAAAAERDGLGPASSAGQSRAAARR